MDNPKSGTTTSADSTVNDFLSSLEDGSFADSAPPAKPVEQLVNEDGTLPVEPVVDNTPQEVTGDENDDANIEPAPSKFISSHKVRDERPQPEIPAGVVPGAKQTRDLSAFPAEAHSHLRQMSNPAFEWVKSEWTKQQDIVAKQTELETRAQTAEAARDTWLYSNKDAYKLSPEYSERTQHVTRLSQEANYWTNALAALEEGKSIRNLVIDENGQLALGDDEIEPSPQVRAAVQAKLASAIQYKSSAETDLRQWIGGHNNKLAEFRNRLDGMSAQLFPQGIPKELQPLVDQTMAKFPAELRGQKEYQLLAQANALIGGLTTQVKQLEDQLKGKAIITKAAKSRGPGNGAPSGDVSAVNGNGLSVDDYLKKMKVEMA